MVALRLTRIGAKKKPSYRLVAVDSRRARDSKTIEILGHYNPRPDPIEIDLKRERIAYWMGVGAQPSETVQRLIKWFDANGANTAQPKREAAQKAAADNKPAPKPAAAPAPPPATKAEEVEAEATAAEAESESSEAAAEAAPAAEAPAAEAPAAEAPPSEDAPPAEAPPAKEEPPVEAPAAEAPAEEADKA